MPGAYFHPNAIPLSRIGVLPLVWCWGIRGAGQMHKLFKQMCIAARDKVIVRTHTKKQHFSEKAFKVISVPIRHSANALIQSDFTALRRFEFLL